MWCILFVAGGISLLQAQPSSSNFGNGLPATDMLGRKLPVASEVGAPRKDKFVGIFFWTWHNHFADQKEVRDVSKVLAAYPEAANDYYHPAWHNDKAYYFWHEPLWGYYRDTDRWVLRKQAEMLTEAGVDVIFFDCTNGSFTWKESYMTLCEEFTRARRDGVKTPQIAFMLGFGPMPSARKALFDIYESLYKPGRYRDLWFRWKGKPLVMAYPELLGEVPGDLAETARRKEIRDFFTFRPGQPLYNRGPERPDHWGWLEVYPQHGFAPIGETGKYEQVTVGVAQNWSKERGLTAMNAPGTFGRSHTFHSIEKKPDSVNYGYNFSEQWERALQLDPEFVFVTGWNEWVAGRAKLWMGQENAFPDQFSQEKSRDIEPMKGGHADSYYYQLVAFIRRFKGMPEKDCSIPFRRMKIDGRFDDWGEALTYETYPGNTLHRDCRGFASLHYINHTGRNDLVRAKVARDKRNLYFYIETADRITSSDGKAWMRLLIDADGERATGWEGYDYILNRLSPEAGKAFLEESRSGWNYAHPQKVDYALWGNQMEIRIPLKLLGLKPPCTFYFKWSDNMQAEGDIMDFYVNGDVAPLGRFNYAGHLE